MILSQIFITSAVAMLSLIPAISFAASSKDVPTEGAEEAAKASKDWLTLLDNGRYGDSWEKASSLLKKTMPKNGWEQVLEKTRKPLGSVGSREAIDQRVAKNPHGLPPGSYMVLFYKTKFAQKAMAYELVTLFNEDGHWRVVTYQVN